MKSVYTQLKELDVRVAALEKGQLNVSRLLRIQNDYAKRITIAVEASAGIGLATSFKMTFGKRTKESRPEKR